jgi:ATP-dependent Zn protease
VTQGYSPAKLEHLLDEGLVNAVRRGTKAMSWNDVEHARLTTEVGLGMPVEYTAGERVLIATHEAGHATVAHLVAPQRRLEVLTIIKRGEALGLLAHGDRDDVYTRSRAELTSMIQISLGGQVAEELFFGDVSTGPAGDLAYATNARGQLEELLHAQQAVVRELLGRNRHLVEALRDGLLEREELIGSEITDLLDAAAAAAAERAVNAAPTVLDLRESEDVRS